MHSRAAALAIAAAVLLAALALGVLAGRRPSPPAAQSRGTLVDAALAIDPPPSWHRVRGPAPLAALKLEHPLLLAGPGAERRDGLVAGLAARPEPGAVASDLAGIVRRIGPASVVGPRGSQALHFGGLELRDTGALLSVYMFPSARGPFTTVACYADRADASFLAACDRVAASARALDPSDVDLTPSRPYAASLRAALGPLDAERASSRARLAHARTRTGQHDLARALAGSYGNAAHRLGAASAPSGPARPAATALAAALTRADTAYRALAHYARTGSRSGFARARADIDAAERAAEQSLSDLTAYGYPGA